MNDLLRMTLRTIVVILGVMSLTSNAYAEFKLTSSDIAEGKLMNSKQVFNGFGCSGENLSPALSWNGAPEGTKSFAITVYDPDAPTGSGWWHWVVFNIPVSTTSLAQGASGSDKIPAGAIESRTDFGTYSYGGACPPEGHRPAHRYIFTIHALDIEKIEADKESSAALIGFNLNFHTLAKSSITVRYQR
jgi:Raf kinase inhibitor-like YbhB/YbcL family protein